ncbi:MAG TPA: ABC transporter permease [Syntrophomonadaceae bacterium]|nr:ABC transporter permease [Syntrophomonadaceae bacterium]
MGNKQRKSRVNVSANSLRFDALGIVLPCLLIAFWYIITSYGRIPAYLLPPPLQVGQVALDFAVGTWQVTPYAGTLWDHALTSTIRVLRGFALAAVLGVPLGLLTGRISVVRRFLDPTVNMLRTVPGIGWLPLAMVWFGVGEKTTLFLIALAAFFPIYINSAQGASSVSPLYLRAGQMLGANRFSLFTTIIMPASFPSLAAGLRLGLGLSWAFVVLGELTGVTHGLGAVMMDARMLGHVDMVMVSMIYIALLGWLSDRILTALLRLIQPF